MRFVSTAYDLSFELPIVTVNQPSDNRFTFYSADFYYEYAVYLYAVYGNVARCLVLF